MSLSDDHYRLIQSEVDQPTEWQRVSFGRDWL